MQFPAAMGFTPAELDPHCGSGIPALQRAEQPLQLESDCPASPWLRAWIEFHVDARVNQALRELAEGQLTKVLNVKAGTCELATSKENQLQDMPQAEEMEQRREDGRLEAEWVQEELRTLAQNQAKLLKVVEDMSNEVSDLGMVAADQKQEATELARSVMQLDSKFSVWRSEVASDVRASAMRDKGESESLRLEALAAAAARGDFEERLEALRLEVHNATRSWFDFERRLNHSQRQLADGLEEWMAEWGTGLQQKLDTRDQSLLDTFRSENSAELRQQQEAVLALDEQLWLTDKRLGVRIDELHDVTRKRSPVQSHNTRSAVTETLAQTAQWGASNGYSSGSHTPIVAETFADSTVDSVLFPRKLVGGAVARHALDSANRHPRDEAAAFAGSLGDAVAEMENRVKPSTQVLEPSRKTGNCKAWRGKLALGPDLEAESLLFPHNSSNLAHLPLPSTMSRAGIPGARGVFLAVEGLAEELLDESE